VKDKEEETLELHRNKKRDKGKERKENRNRKNEPDRKVCPGWQPVFFFKDGKIMILRCVRRE